MPNRNTKHDYDHQKCNDSNSINIWKKNSGIGSTSLRRALPGPMVYHCRTYPNLEYRSIMTLLILYDYFANV